MTPLVIGDATVYTGNALAVLKTLPDNSVHCCATSPPYFGLRDYGTASWAGGDPACDHLAPAAHGYSPYDSSTLGPKRDGISESNSSHADAVKRKQFRDVCGKCGATRVDEQIGIEPTPEEYVASLVAVFREVRRVLHPSGVLWLNLGDSYASTGGHVGGAGPTSQRQGRSNIVEQQKVKGYGGDDNIKSKDLIGIPWMVAFALRADGWYLRSDVIWAKPNPMPESTEDRCTKSHEYIFMLTKSPRYFFDNVAISEPAVSSKSGNTARKSATARDCPRDGVDGSVPWEGDTRNKRTVWTVSTQSYEGAHFACWPPKLVEPMILAGTSAHGVCPSCLSPWERVTEKDRQPTRPALDSKVQSEKNRLRDADGFNSDKSTLASFTGNRDPERHCTTVKTIGWEPTCDCDSPAVIPATVLDPFAGSGTTLEVASKYNRNSIGIELNPKYVELIRERLLSFQDREVGMFALAPEESLF